MTIISTAEASSPRSKENPDSAREVALVERRTTHARHLLRSTTGAIVVEYLVVLGLVGFPVTLALLYHLGPALVGSYSRQRAALYQSYP